MKKNKDIAIGISTFLRDNSLFRLIDSILNYLPEIRMYIVDQGYFSPKKKIIYDGLKRNGHIIKYIPYDSGISQTRWVLKDICQEPYLVFMEDDFEVTEKTNLYKLKEILDENEDLGIVGGNLQGYATTGAYSFFFDYADNKIGYFPLDYLVEKNLTQWETTSKNIKFIRADIVSDFTMWKKEVPNIFDKNVKVIEHTMVYLLVKYKTKYKVAFCPESELKHLHSSENDTYNSLRKRTHDLDYIKQYWNISDFLKFSKPELYKLENLIPQIDSTEIKSVDNIKKENNISDFEVIPKIVDNQTKVPECTYVHNILSDLIISELEKNQIAYVCIENTCLEIITKKPLTLPLKLAVQTESIKNYLINNIKNIDVTIQIFKQTKSADYKNFKINVPFPVINYLEKTFNKSWKELINE